MTPFGVFNRRYLEHLVDQHQSSLRDYSYPLWSLLMFEAFLRRFQQGGQPLTERAA